METGGVELEEPDTSGVIGGVDDEVVGGVEVPLSAGGDVEGGGVGLGLTDKFNEDVD